MWSWQKGPHVTGLGKRIHILVLLFLMGAGEPPGNSPDDPLGPQVIVGFSETAGGHGRCHAFKDGNCNLWGLGFRV